MSIGGLTDNQIQLVEENFVAIAPHGAELVAKFYERLFRDFPDLKPMFAHTTPAVQQEKLLASLVLIVQNLRTPDVLQPALEQLGVRHYDYGVEPEHYQAVGSTLLKTLAELTDDVWGSELEEAWAAAYDAISQQMIESAALAAS